MSEEKFDTEVPPWLKEVVDLARPLKKKDIEKVIESFVQPFDSQKAKDKLLDLNNIFEVSGNARARIRKAGVELLPVEDEEYRESTISAAISDSLSPFFTEAIVKALSKLKADEQVSKLSLISTEINRIRFQLEINSNNKLYLNVNVIKNLVKACTKLFNLSQKDIARQTGLDQSTIYNLFNGKKLNDKSYGILAKWLGRFREEMDLSSLESDELISELPLILNKIRYMRFLLKITLNNTLYLDADIIKNLVLSCMELFALSQRAISQQPGLDQSSISDLLNGRKQPDKTYVALIKWLEAQTGRFIENMELSSFESDELISFLMDIINLCGQIAITLEDKQASGVPLILRGINNTCGQVDITLDDECNPDVIKDLLQSYMKLFNLSQMETAHQIGLSHNSIFKLLKGTILRDRTYATVGDWLKTQKDRIVDRMAQPDIDDILEPTEIANIQKFLEV